MTQLYELTRPRYAMVTMLPLARIVESWFRRHQIPLGPIVAAVSGGPDSVALLLVLLEVRDRACASFGVETPPLVIAHLNHKLRENESDSDEEFVRNLHARLLKRGKQQIEFHGKSVNVREAAAQVGDNLENFARTLRYDWLADLALQSRARLIATGHTANDQAETVLHRLVRGTGLRGLAGIPAIRELPGEIQVIRPLLSVTREDILKYLESLGQDYREDSSNKSAEFTRNRIRNELIPQLAQDYNPAIVSVLNSLAEQTADIVADLEQRARSILSRAELPRAGVLIILDVSCMNSHPGYLIRELFRRLWERESWPQREMGFREWDQLAKIVGGEVTACQLPGGISARRRERVVQIGPLP